jgi:hypothetical protein
VGHEAAVFSAAAWNNDVVISVRFPVPIAQFDQFAFARAPIDTFTLKFGKIARGAYSMLIERDARTLVRNRTFLAKPDVDRQLILTDYISLFHIRHCSLILDLMVISGTE